MAGQYTAKFSGLAFNTNYDVYFYNQQTMAEKNTGTVMTNNAGFGSVMINDPDAARMFDTIQLRSTAGEVVQYTVFGHNMQQGFICKMSQGTIVTTNLDQTCFECPCGVKYSQCKEQM